MEIGNLFDILRDSSNDVRNIIGKKYPKISGAIATLLRDARHCVMIDATYESIINNQSEVDEKTVSMIKNTFKKGGCDDFLLEYEIIIKEIENTEFADTKVFSSHKKFFYALKAAILSLEEKEMLD